MERAPIGWVLYDDSCGFCRRWIPFWAETLRKRGYAIAPLQSEWLEQKLNAPEEDLLQDLRLLLADGSVVRGADVYRCMCGASGRHILSTCSPSLQSATS